MLAVIVVFGSLYWRAPRGTVMVSATSPDSSVTVGSGSVMVEGMVSVVKIPAGMGLVPAGTVVPITGTGFTSSTTVSIDGVVLSSVEFVSSTEIDVTIGGAAELAGKLARVTESGVKFHYFCFQSNDSVNFPESTGYGPLAANVQPLFPLAAVTGAYAYTNNSAGVVEIQNPNTTEAAVSFSAAEFSLSTPFGALATVTIPPGSWTIVDGFRCGDRYYFRCAYTAGGDEFRASGISNAPADS